MNTSLRRETLRRFMRDRSAVLGLAIAQSIARRHHATIALGTSDRLGGLLVTVRFSSIQ